MIHLEWIFFTQLVLGILMILFLQKLTQIEKQIDGIVKEVDNYISYIAADEGEKMLQQISSENKSGGREKKKEEHKKEELQNQLIQEVLSEYFP